MVAASGTVPVAVKFRKSALVYLGLAVRIRLLFRVGSAVVGIGWI